MEEKGSNETRMEEKKEKGIKSNVEKKSVSETELGDTRTHTKKETHQKGKTKAVGTELSSKLKIE